MVQGLMVQGVYLIADPPTWQTEAVPRMKWAALTVQGVMPSLVVRRFDVLFRAVCAVGAASGPRWHIPHPGSCGWCRLQRRGRGGLHNEDTKVCRNVARRDGW